MAADTTSLKYLDSEHGSTSVSMRIWQMAGLSSENVNQAAVVNWMILGVFFTREFLHKMKKKSSLLYAWGVRVVL